MKIKITFSRNDVMRVRDVVNRMAEHDIVVERHTRNVCRQNIDLSHATLWKRLLGCLLTTQQKSSKDSAVQRYLRSNSPLLSLRQCKKTANIEKLAESELSSFGGIRRTTVIPKQISYNYNWLSDSGWAQLDAVLVSLEGSTSQNRERDCANKISNLLRGFGPKQSRNLLQWLGLTQYEIPIDSRILKWLRELGHGKSLDLLSSAALAENDYYCCIMDTIQELCAEANVLPCIFDASVFASFE